MVFDPVNMCWLKRPQSGKSDESDPMDGFNAFDDEEDDVFKDIPDLEDKNKTADSGEAAQGRISEIKDDWLVGEEFDVGPEFVRRTREEEVRWRKKLVAWQTGLQDRDDSWKWKIREIVNTVGRD